MITLEVQGLTLNSSLSLGIPDVNLRNIDLLGTIGETLPLGVSVTKGPHTRPAFHFRPIANVGRFARYIFPNGFFAEFSITLTIRPKKGLQHGVVFAILPHFRRKGAILGLEIRNVRDRTEIRLTHAGNDANTKTVFEFTVPDISNKWTWLGFSIEKNGVTFFKDCDNAERGFRDASLDEITLPLYSVLYIGRAGWTSEAGNSVFEVTLTCVLLFNMFTSLSRIRSLPFSFSY